MFYIVITLLILGFPILYLLLKRKLHTPGGVVLFLYFSSFLSAAFIDHFSEWYTVEASVFLGIVLLLFFIPIIIHASRNNGQIIIGNHRMLLPFAWLLVMFGAVSIASLMLKIGNIFENILMPTAYRSQKISGAIIVDSGVLDYISLIGLNWYYFQLVLFFIITIIYPEKKLLRACLFMSSLAYPLNALAVDMSRGGLLLWMLMAMLIYVSLYRYIEKDFRKRINKWLCVCIMLIVALFLLVTYGRGVASGDIWMYFIDYFSHQFGNFNRFYAVATNQPNDITSIFQILGYERQSLMDEAEVLLAAYGFSINVFATFVGDFIIGFDPVIVLLMAFAFALLFGYLIRSNGRGFGTLLLVFSICEVFVWGLFYYNHRWRISNLLFLAVIALRYLFNPRPGSNSIVIKPCPEFLKSKRPEVRPSTEKTTALGV